MEPNTNPAFHNHSAAPNLPGYLPVSGETERDQTNSLRLIAHPPIVDLQRMSKTSGWHRVLQEEHLPAVNASAEAPRIIIAPLTPENRTAAQSDQRNVWILEPESVQGKAEALGFHNTGSREAGASISTEGRHILLPNNASQNTLRANDETVNESLETMRSALRTAHQILDIPYVHLWYYPQRVSSVFLFRVDVDYVVPKALEVLHDLSSEYGIKGTYFVNVSGEEEYEDEIGQGMLERPTTPERIQQLLTLSCTGNEIANHGFWHDIFPSAEENRANIERGQRELRDLFNRECSGFAAPGAESTEALHEALSNFDFTYVANTLAEHGSFPYPIPHSKSGASYELPGCSVSDLGFENMTEREAREKVKEDIVEFYRELIAAHAESGMPVNLIVHPHLGGEEGRSFFEPIFAEVKDKGLLPMTHLEFAEWWKHRAETQLTVDKAADGALHIKTDLPSAIVEILFRGERQLVELKS